MALAALVLPATAAYSKATHPLDPLSSQEISAAISVLRDAGLADTASRFPLIDLDEPPKAEMLAWRPGQNFARKAFVIIRRDRTVTEAVVDLGARKLDRSQAIPGVQSGVLIEEWEKAQQITIADADWQNAMRQRGYGAFDKLFCAPLSVGYFGDPAEEGRRLVRVTCFDIAGTRNVWGRPIEGLYATVDLDAHKVIRLSDSGAVPVSREAHSFGERRYTTQRKTTTSPRQHADAHAAFTIEDYGVRWKNWSFHYRMDRRAGLIVSLVRHLDAGRPRLVLYRGSVAEMFVPYMDPDGGWAFRTYLDVGEYGFGLLSSPLSRGVDCPTGAVMLDAVLPDDTGRPLIAKSVICLFERHTGSPLWRHAESVNRTYAGRPEVELVLRTIPSVGNYDYVIDWVLTEAGIIRIDVGATGIDEVKGVAARTMSDPSAARDTAHGALVAPNLVAVNHDHFLSFRLDVDIDGAGNTLVRQKLSPQMLEGNAGRRSLWRVVEQQVSEEGALPGGGHRGGKHGGTGHGGGAVWRIVNPNLTNRLGQHPGYELRPGHSATSLLAAEDFPQRRAAFSAAPLWITAYDPRELYAAGMYPNQSKGGDGLPAFVAQHRPVENADIVLWYTMGFHHLPRPEDWPVMTTMRHSVSLVPYGFFDRNPSLDRPQEVAYPQRRR